MQRASYLRHSLLISLIQLRMRKLDNKQARALVERSLFSYLLEIFWRSAYVKFWAILCHEKRRLAIN